MKWPPSAFPHATPPNVASVKTTSIDSESLECQGCKRAYEVKYGPDGDVRLLAV